MDIVQTVLSYQIRTFLIQKYNLRFSENKSPMHQGDLNKTFRRGGFKYVCRLNKGTITWTSVVDPWHFGTDPDPRLWPVDPDPVIFVLDIQDAKKNYFFLSFSAHYFLKVHLHHFYKIKNVTKKSQNSRNQGFSFYFCLMIGGSGSEAGSVLD